MFGMQPTVSPHLNNDKNGIPNNGNGPVDLDAPGAEFGLDVRYLFVMHISTSESIKKLSFFVYI